MRIRYVSKKFVGSSLAVIEAANVILREYEAQGFDLTLRQLYYQFVSRDLLPNTQASYNRLGSIINDARMAGLVDWDHIVDRTRNVREWTSYTSPADAARQLAERYRRPRWEDQPVHVEVWIEKDALVGVIERTCYDLMVPFFSCRGYTSQSEMWGASQRLYKAALDGKIVQIFHLGDHDPSGIDMTRDITDRLSRFMATDWYQRRASEIEEQGGDASGVTSKDAWLWLEQHLVVSRIALTIDQVNTYNPPPNPAKLTDSRARDYLRQFGPESWELDALSPTVMDRLIRVNVEDVMDRPLYDAQLEREDREIGQLERAADEWEQNDGS